MKWLVGLVTFDNSPNSTSNAVKCVMSDWLDMRFYDKRFVILHALKAVWV